MDANPLRRNYVSAETLNKLALSVSTSVTTVD